MTTLFFKILCSPMPQHTCALSLTNPRVRTPWKVQTLAIFSSHWLLENSGSRLLNRIWGVLLLNMQTAKAISQEIINMKWGRQHLVYLTFMKRGGYSMWNWSSNQANLVSFLCLMLGRRGAWLVCAAWYGGGGNSEIPFCPFIPYMISGQMEAWPQGERDHLFITCLHSTFLATQQKL